MSQQYGQNRSPGGGGSVRKARERMEAGLQMPLPQRAYDPRNSPPKRTKPQIPPMPPAPASTRTVGVAISRPTQVPQWPLAGSIEGPDVQSNWQDQPRPNRGPAPQRPPRPSHVPSMLDASRLQDPTPSFQYRPQQNITDQNKTQWRDTALDDEDTRSPVITSPMTQSSRRSTVSSVGSIPDFPIPVLGPPRRSAHLGPPPSSRRGASSYYSQASFVSPIPEESPRTQTTHGSYASSAAIPSNWGSEYEYDEESPEEIYKLYDREAYTRDLIDERGESRESANDDGDERGLIRSASIGKRAKPLVITTRSSESVPSAGERKGVSDEQNGKFAGLAVPLGGNETGRENITGRGFPQQTRGVKPGWPMPGNASSRLAGGTGLLDASTSSLDLTTPTTATVPHANEGVSPLSPTPDSDKRAKELLGAYKRASTLQPGGAPQTSKTSSPSNAFSRLSAIRRPPKLDIDAVRDAEARGSLTSLPDLIRRATKLAAMMDRGKRPGSRLNDLSDFPMDEKVFEVSRDYSSNSEKHGSGFSRMLAAFPPPGVVTPRDGTPRNGTPRGERPLSQWPELDGNDPNFYPNFGDQTNGAKKRRRCCGLPCWCSIVIILILLIIIAAAVVVPLELLVFHRPNPSTANLSPIQQCEANTATACQNGGATVLDNGACSCVCTNGFTGSTCSIAGTTGCTTTTIGDFNATLGDSLPRLLTAAQTNFSIPLNTNTLLARFNSGNLSCASENALITFDGSAQRRWNAEDEVEVPTVRFRARHGSSQKTNDKFIVTKQALDFARVAVLYVLQEQQLDNAVNAQSSLQSFFHASAFTNRAARNVTLGNGNAINLVDFTVDLGDGAGPVGSKNTTVSQRPVRRRSRHLWSAVFK